MRGFRIRAFGPALVAVAVATGVFAGTAGPASAWDAGLQLCKAADNSAGTVSGTFQFTVTGTQDQNPVTVPVSVDVGTCSGVLLFDAGSVSVAEIASSGTTLVGISTDPTAALQSSDLNSRTAVVNVTNFATVVATFTNRNAPPVQGCTLTWGYYKTHSSVVTTLVTGNGGLLVGATKLTAAQVNALLAINENGPNYLIKLVHQLIAAELNQLGASTPAAVQTAIDAANALIAAHGGPNGSATSGTTIVFGGVTYTASQLNNALDGYNNGLAAGGPAHCGTVFTLFGQTAPLVADSGDPGANVELGVKFTADQSGFVTGIRFFKSAANTGPHTGSLWSGTGTLLATVALSGETASGWQQATFSSAVAITAGATYVASYHTTTGHYASTHQAFASSFDNPPLHAPASGASGGNGVFLYGPSAFPTQTFDAQNYWVDLTFTP